MTSLAFAYSHFVPQQKQGMASRRLESLEDKAKAHAECTDATMLDCFVSLPSKVFGAG